MQLRVTALASIRLCVRDGQGWGPGGAAAHQIPLTTLRATLFQKELTSWTGRLGSSSELSPERLAEAMDSGQVRTSEAWMRHL